MQRTPCASEWPLPSSPKSAEGTAANQSETNADVNMIKTVHNTLRDISRRKSNVVVSGLPESNRQEPAFTAASSYGIHLRYKPYKATQATPQGPRKH